MNEVFNKPELSIAIDLQKRSYKLLRWLSESISRGFISFEAAHEYASLPESTARWIESHYENVPPEARPEVQDLTHFSNLFATYLESSFELQKDPGLMGASDWCCSFCNVMVDAPHLRTKKTTPTDKRKARKLRVDAIVRFAAENGFAPEDETVDRIVDQPENREATALLAYEADLGRRLRGHSSGAATLVLWRGFAWTKKGSPKTDFELNPDMFLRAREHIFEHLSHYEDD